jgi:hypothetical protein
MGRPELFGKAAPGFRLCTEGYILQAGPSKKKCAVIYTWLAEIREEDIRDYAGRVYGETLNEILLRVSELS